MGAAPPLADGDRELLLSLNRLSLEQSFDPELDLDWTSHTTDGEFLALYDAWSLLAGSGKDGGLDARARIDFARYQQLNLMLFTTYLERYGLQVLDQLRREETEPEMVVALGHFAQEEMRHQAMFVRAVAMLEGEMPARPRLPRRHVEAFMRFAFALLARLPLRRARIPAGFMLLEFAEQISIVAHTVASRAVPRKDSFVARVWALHALDEARHLRFDALIGRRYRPSPALALAVRLAAVPLALFSSFLLNANDVWAARRVGARVSLWQLPMLVRRSNAPFKRKVFSTIARLLARPGP